MCQEINWFDGKKTIIGLVGLNVLQLDLKFYETMNPDLYTLLLYVFGALAAGGLVHKGVKKVKEDPKKKA